MKAYNGQNITYDRPLSTIKIFVYVHMYFRNKLYIFITRKLDLFHRKYRFLNGIMIECIGVILIVH